ncbi:MAG: phytoene desaturase family protein [Polyangiaceae bacterium]
MEKGGRVLVVGAGIGGLTAAVELARRGLSVTVVEKAPRVGGKMREVLADGRAIDSGPTVLTMRRIFDEVFEAAGKTLDEHVTLDRADLLARHAWTDGSTLDLWSDIDRSADAIGTFAGPREARGYRRFCEHTRKIHELVEGTFLLGEKPSFLSVVKAFGTIGVGALLKMDGYRTLHTALGDFFQDRRLLQLFGRYATYSGSSPFSAPATLNVIAHVEREGVWLVRGGMYRLAEALCNLAVELGVTVRTGVAVTELLVESGRAAGARLSTGEVLHARHVVVNADAAALVTGLFGKAVRRAADTPGARSLSAMTWSAVAETAGFDLVRHNVFFSDDYAREFRQLFDEDSVPSQPTVYICAQDRDDSGLSPSHEAASGERLLCLINAPASGDRRTFSPTEIQRCEQAMNEVLRRCGLTMKPSAPPVVTTPSDFDRMFPATGGALYGAASHGLTAPFSRPAARSRIPGLYLCGGSAHPGAGVPMVAQSGRLVALSLMQDLASTPQSRWAAMRGGMSTQ